MTMNDDLILLRDHYLENLEQEHWTLAEVRQMLTNFVADITDPECKEH